MALGPQTPQRGGLLAAAGSVAAAAAILVALALNGAFSGEEEDDPQATIAAPSAIADTPGGPGGELPQPRSETIRVGGRPTGVAVGEDGVWVADPFSARASVVEPNGGGALDVSSFALQGPTSAVAAGGDSVFYALQEREALERRDPLHPAAAGETIELDGFASTIEIAEGGVWALIENAVVRIDPASGEIEDEYSVGGFSSALAVADGFVWVVADNREVSRLDPETGESEEDPVEVPDAFNVAVGEGSAWVVSASGSVTRIDAGSLAVVGDPIPVRGALDVAVGEGAVWVTSSRRTVTRIDPSSGEIVGAPLEVGDEPVSVSIGEGAVWVANAGDGTLTRIEP